MKFIILGCGSSMGVPRADGFFGKMEFSETLRLMDSKTLAAMGWVYGRIGNDIRTLVAEFPQAVFEQFPDQHHNFRIRWSTPKTHSNRPVPFTQPLEGPYSRDFS